MKSNLLELITVVGEKSAFAFRFAGYPPYIKESMERALTVYCVKHDINDEDAIDQLSELVDDVAFCIEMSLIENKKNQIMNKKEDG